MKGARLFSNLVGGVRLLRCGYDPETRVEKVLLEQIPGREGGRQYGSLCSRENAYFK